ncbi:hypothetical protein L3X38_034429 [Prunus dulcis]|uniref:Uncharacterized protein n=1 Tax=Prunus dulcis TaxID=3755 RepID=A0AAD4VHU6_PRUDU|nr:hypothetical protein L3X38_034429 [Prunus dulcis]
MLQWKFNILPQCNSKPIGGIKGFDKSLTYKGIDLERRVMYTERDGYLETEAMQLLLRTNLHSPAPNEMHKYGQFSRRPLTLETPKCLHTFPPHFNSPNNYHHVQFPSSSEGGRIGSDLSPLDE